MNKQQQEGLLDMAAAIRKGATMYPPCTASLFTNLDSGIEACCALGAAWIGSHLDWTPFQLRNWGAKLSSFSEIDRHFGVEDLLIPFPQDVAYLHFKPPYPVSEVAWKLTDFHLYSRERVADYLEQVANEYP